MPHGGVRTPSSSGRPSPAVSPRLGRSRHVSPMLRQQPMGTTAAAPPPALPALPHTTASQSRQASSSRASSLGSASDGAKQSKRKNKKNKKNKKEKKRTQPVVPMSSGTVTGTSEADAESAARRASLALYFSHVELTFQLHLDRAQRSSIFPRDIGNLLLWSVPSSIPLVESPRIFFVKNKSKIRDVVVIYVNGWSYDQMMCTGVGLPRRASASHPAATPAVASGEIIGTKRARGAEEAQEREGTPAEEEEEEAVVWNEKICHALLQPVRRSACWARENGGGVQHSPLIIPSMKNALEADLFWRNDAPKVPGQNRSSTSHNTADGVGEAERPVRSVKDMFEKAKEIHSNTQSPVAANTAIEPLPAPASSEAADTMPPAVVEAQHGEADASAAEAARLALWEDRALLDTYALRLPDHLAAFAELGFLVEPPSESDVDDEEAEESRWRSFPAAAASRDSEEGQHVRVLAFDCEMVLAEPPQRQRRPQQQQAEGPMAGCAVTAKEVEASSSCVSGVSVLARATLVDVRTGAVVLDELVKPETPVLDYLTRFSGIDAAMLANVTLTLSQCQDKLCALIDTETYVVGHSLENDFKACKLVPNCRVLDTAWLFPHPSGLPYKNALRFLAQRYLGKRIQQGAHDSSIDAITSAELTLLKLENGPTFGVRKKVSVLGLMTDAVMPACETPSPSSEAAPAPKASQPPQSLAVHIKLFDEATNLITMVPRSGSSGQQQQQKQHGTIDTIPVRHDEDATRKVVRALRQRVTAMEAAMQRTGGDRDNALAQTAFTCMWVQLSETEVDVVMPTRNDARAALPGSCKAEREAWRQAREDAQLEKVATVNQRVLRIIEACPDETMVIILAGSCSGEAGGNHFSRAQGSCFAFIKDSSAPGPPEAAPAATAAGVTTKAVKVSLEEATPPACAPS